MLPAAPRSAILFISASTAAARQRRRGESAALYQSVLHIRRIFIGQEFAFTWHKAMSSARPALTPRPGKLSLSTRSSPPSVAVGKGKHLRAMTSQVSTTANAVGHVFGAPRPMPELSNIKGVLFDIDGTLCNSDPLHLKVFQEILVEVGFSGIGGQPIDDTFFRENIAGRHNPDIVADFFPEWTEGKGRAFSADKEARFRAIAELELERMPGLTAFLQWMNANSLAKVAVTNAPRLNAECMLGGMDLNSEFSALIIGEECTQPKPHPDPYLLGLKALGLKAEEVVAIEDSPSGMRSAVAAGIPTIGILSGQTAESLKAAGASYLINDYNDLLALVPMPASL